MTSYSGEPISSQTANDAGAVAEVSAGYIAHSAGEGLNSVPGGAVCPPGYKQTELGVIPESWIIRSIGDLCNYQNGKAQEKYFNSNDGYKVVSIGNYSESGRYVETGSYIEQRFKNEVGRFLLNRGDLAMILNDKTAVGTIIGRVLLIDADESYVMNQRTMRLTPKAHATSEYLHCLINSDSVHKRIVGMAKPGTQIYVNTDDVLNFNLPLPESEEEQTAIANALSDVDALISELEKLIAKKQAIKTATMQQLLTGRTRLPQFALREDGTPTNSSGTNLDAGTGGPKGEGHDGLRKGTKPSELGEIPEDWEVVELGKLLAYEQPTNYLISHTKFLDEGLYPVLTAGKSFILGYTNEEHGVFTNLPVIIFDDFTTDSKFVDFPFKAKSSAMKMLKPINKNTPLSLIYNLLNSVDYLVGDHKRHWIGEFQFLNVAIPSKENEQTAIATILSDMDAEIQTLEQRLGKTRQIKQGMMQELLTGKTRLIKPSKEVIHE